MTVIIHGPQSCGKTKHAAALAAHFGCSEVVDNWCGARCTKGALLLTNAEVLVAAVIDDARVLSFAEAMRLTGLSTIDPVADVGCPCGNDGCNGYRFRQPYAIASEACPLASAQSSENTAATTV